MSLVAVQSWGLCCTAPPLHHIECTRCKVLQVGSLCYSSSMLYPKSLSCRNGSLKSKWIKCIIHFPFLPPLKIDPSGLHFSRCIPVDGAFTCRRDSHRFCLRNTYNPNLFQNSLKWGAGLDGLQRFPPASTILSSCEQPDVQ